MLYVARDGAGQIRELHPMPLGEAQEAVAADNPEALQFIHERWRQNELSELDRDFIRAIEDTIELLIAKEIILFTDLPPRVQEKLLRRKEIRGQTHYAGNYGTTDDSDIIPL
ncbi:hypothetical protein [Dechloromonas denitrificans]|jgi:hypothetical protein|uniref:hypothetical protein n=1 Tax=Azonexaceae TaxID=2008795 RepID=UPI001CF80689|nr:hypothetical protein [Dechloromonas denitrificans]UCV02562.1 hypothetical protein KI611_15950 [Dechloromonas denitrificans]UCV06858.1 hypothetical protein KI615_15825 [Dechloromonas denitrificans]